MKVEQTFCTCGGVELTIFPLEKQDLRRLTPEIHPELYMLSTTCLLCLNFTGYKGQLHEDFDSSNEDRRFYKNYLKSTVSSAAMANVTLKLVIRENFDLHKALRFSLNTLFLHWNPSLCQVGLEFYTDQAEDVGRIIKQLHAKQVRRTLKQCLSTSLLSYRMETKGAIERFPDLQKVHIKFFFVGSLVRQELSRHAPGQQAEDRGGDPLEYKSLVQRFQDAFSTAHDDDPVEEFLSQCREVHRYPDLTVQITLEIYDDRAPNQRMRSVDIVLRRCYKQLPEARAVFEGSSVAEHQI